MGVPTTGNPSGTVQNVSAGDVLCVNSAKTGFCQASRSLLAVGEPTVQTFGQIPYIAPGGTATTYISPQGSLTGQPFGRILQDLLIQDTTGDSTSNNATLATLPTTSTTAVIAGLSVNITPLSASSSLIIEALINLTTGSADTSVVGALFITAGSGTSANAIAAATNICHSTGKPIQILIKYEVSSSSVLARTYQLGFGATVNNPTTYNSVDGSTKLFGGTLGVVSWLRVTEYL